MSAHLPLTLPGNRVLWNQKRVQEKAGCFMMKNNRLITKSEYPVKTPAML